MGLSIILIIEDVEPIAIRHLSSMTLEWIVKVVDQINMLIIVAMFARTVLITALHANNHLIYSEIVKLPAQLASKDSLLTDLKKYADLIVPILHNTSTSKNTNALGVPLELLLMKQLDTVIFALMDVLAVSEIRLHVISNALVARVEKPLIRLKNFAAKIVSQMNSIIGRLNLVESVHLIKLIRIRIRNVRHAVSDALIASHLLHPQKLHLLA